MNAETVWNDFADGLHRFIRARVACDADADDILQDVFVKILGRQDQLRDDERLAGWVFRIASNAVTDHHRKQRRPARMTAPQGSAADNSAEEELATCMRPFISQLEEPYRSAITWTEIEGLTQRAAAERAQISVSGMKSRVQRGRTQLRTQFETCCDIRLDARNRVIGYEAKCSSPSCSSGIEP